MTWAKMEGETWSDPTMTALSDGAFRLYWCATSYAVDKLTDGTLTSRQVELVATANRLRRVPALTEELVTSGLWQVSTLGWEIVGFLDRNLSAKDYEGRRVKDKQRLAEWREKQARAPELHLADDE